MPSDPILQCSDFSYTYHGCSTPILDRVSFRICAGECVVLSGPSGCGKSTLLLALKGLLRGGTSSGEMRHFAAHGTGNAAVALVFQNVETQILCSTVSEEVAFGPENLCLSQEEITRRVRRSLKAVGLLQHHRRSVERFSAGQKQRLAIAASLALEPRLLLLDEPTSQLDDEGKRELVALLAELKAQGYALLVTEHNLEPFRGIADRYLHMEGGRIVEEAAAIPQRRIGPRYERQAAAACHGLALDVTGLTLSYPETGTVLREVTVQVPAGRRVHLAGTNGAGKSSFLRCMVGMERPDSGTLSVAGVTRPEPGRLLGRVGLLVQNPGRQLFENSVTEEVAFSLRKLGWGASEIRERVAETLELCEIVHLRNRAPLTLSFGEQHRVALACVLAPRPSVLLLDEPFAGLDWEQRQRLLAILYGLPHRFGTSVVVASHDPLPDTEWADQSILLAGGRLGE